MNGQNYNRPQGNGQSVRTRQQAQGGYYNAAQRDPQGQMNRQGYAAPQGGGRGGQQPQIYSTQYQGENYGQVDPAIRLRQMQYEKMREQKRRKAEAERKRREKEARMRRRRIIFLLLAAILLITGIVFIVRAVIRSIGSGGEAQLTGGRVTQATVADPFAPNGETDENGDPVFDDEPAEYIEEPPETTAAPVETAPPQPVWENYTFGFKSDLSLYEEYMNPQGDEYLTLINTSHPLGENYAPSDLVDIADTRKDGRAVQQMREYAEKSLEAFLIEARANGFSDVTVTSGYRTYAYQQQLFNSRLSSYSYLGDEAAYAATAQIIAIPGTSEHQSGLCADMHNLASADVSFGKTEAGKWMAANCYKFGFIIRYPAEKVDITGISYEPWHFRYVGRYHACKMWEQSLCLEEYWQKLGKN